MFSAIVMGFVELQTGFGLLSNSVFILRPRSHRLRKQQVLTDLLTLWRLITKVLYALNFFLYLLF